MTAAAAVEFLVHASEGRPVSVIACSSACFLALNSALRVLLQPRIESLLGRHASNPGRVHEQLGVFVNHTITILHVIIATLGVHHMLVNEGGWELLSTAPLSGQLPSTNLLYPVSAGYVLYDVVDLFRTYSSKARSSPPHWILIHHLALLGGGVFSCAAAGVLGNSDGWGFRPSHCAAQPLIMLLYTNEVNALFMLTRVLLRLLGCRISSSETIQRLAYRINLLFFALSFGWGRLWMSGKGVVASYSLYAEAPAISMAGTAFGALFLGMNVGLGIAVWQRELTELGAAEVGLCRSQRVGHRNSTGRTTSSRSRSRSPACSTRRSSRRSQQEVTMRSASKP